jgi:Protein of unknown function (DUF1189)
MKKVLGFYRTFFQTLGWKSYEGFAESTTKNTFNYYFALTFNVFAIMLILMLPMFIQLPNKVESYFDNNIGSFTFNIDFKTIKPIEIPSTNPVIIINYENKTPSDTANIIINNNILYTGFLMQKYVKDFSTYKDAKQNKNAVSNIIAVILLLMTPTLALIGYFYIVLKYFAIILLATLIALLLAPILGYKVKSRAMFNTAVYGISLTALLDLIFFATGFSFYNIQYLPLFMYLVAGILQTGDKVDKKMKGKFLEVKG